MPPESLDQDWQLRLAAMAALRAITDRSGGVMTRAQMTQGFQFDGERVPFANRARGIWKPARLGARGAALSITTASIRRNVSPRYDDQIGSDDEWFEYRYQGTDPQAADNRAVRRAHLLGRPLIYFYRDGRLTNRGPEYDEARPTRSDPLGRLRLRANDPRPLLAAQARPVTGTGKAPGILNLTAAVVLDAVEVKALPLVEF